MQEDYTPVKEDFILLPHAIFHRVEACIDGGGHTVTLVESALNLAEDSPFEVRDTNIEDLGILYDVVDTIAVFVITLHVGGLGNLDAVETLYSSKQMLKVLLRRCAQRQGKQCEG